MKVGDHVRMNCMLGTNTPPSDVQAHENYWRMIGMEGTIEDVDTKEHFPNRVLVKFDKDVSAMGLECHNPIPNTLWILSTDLEVNDVSKSD